MSPKSAEQPPQPPGKPGHGSIPEDTARRLEDRAHAFAEATSRPAGKPFDGATYGRSTAPTDKQRADRKRAIADAKRRARERDAQE